MNSSHPSSPRRTASHLAWTGSKFVRNPLLTLSEEGEILSIEECTEIDRMACTEFYAGITVGHFPRDYREAFARMLARKATPLEDLLREFTAPRGITVVISGVDYSAMRLTCRAQIRRL